MLMPDGPDNGMLTTEIERLKKENQRLHSELERSQSYEGRFNLLIENTHEWIWEVDKNGVYTYASPQVKEVFGYDPEELIGKTPFSIMPPDEAKRVGAIFANIIRYQQAFSKLPNKCYHKDGRILEIETSGSPIFDDEGKLAGYRGIDHDRSLEKRHEEELERKNLELAWQNDLLTQIVEQKTDLQLVNLKLEQRIAEEVEKNRAKEALTFQQNKLLQMGEMVSMIAHQWRQPLAAISARASYIYLQCELGNLDADTYKESSLFIESQCQKMSKTIDTFMNFSKPVQQEATFDMRTAVDTVLEIIHGQLHNNEIVIEVIEPDDEVLIEGAQSLLEQVLLNLIANAKDAFEVSRKADKRINVTLQARPTAAIFIEDNAGGIAPEIRDKIFNPYFTTKAPGKGTGIGLYMSQDIIKKRFNGDLQYVALPEGTRFELYFKQ